MMILREPQASDEVVLRLAHEEVLQDGMNFLLDGFSQDLDFETYLQNVVNTRNGKNLSPDRVRARFLVACVGDEIVGRISIRFSLNEWLSKFGGHIGYAVRPSFRRKGFASEILRLGLVVAKRSQLERVLITCLDENKGSIRVIEKNGGVLESKVVDQGKLLRRYWIDLS